MYSCGVGTVEFPQIMILPNKNIKVGERKGTGGYTQRKDVFDRDFLIGKMGSEEV